MRLPWIIIVFLLAGCSGGQLSGQSAKKEKAKSQPDAGSSGGSDLQTDDEVEKASKPVQVSGAFLTLSCGEDDSTPAAAGQASQGCVFNDADGVKYSGSVSVTRVAVVYGDGTKDVPTFTPAPDDSSWHVLFALDAAKVAAVSSYQVQADVDGQAVRMASLPHGTVTVTLPEVTGSGTDTGTGTAVTCTPPVVSKTFTKLFAAHQDWGNEQAGGNGLDPVTLLDGKDLLPGDQLRYVSASGHSIARIDSTGKTSFVSNCPSQWLLNFIDAGGKAIGGDAGVKVSSLTDPVAVPDGTDHVVVGFHENDKKTYPDNEGMKGLADPKTGSTNGCTFHMEILRASCS